MAAYRDRKVDLPYEERVLRYIGLLGEGYGRNYARALSGLRDRRKDYQRMKDDPRVQAAHEKERLARNKARKFMGAE